MQPVSAATGEYSKVDTLESASSAHVAVSNGEVVSPLAQPSYSGHESAISAHERESTSSVGSATTGKGTTLFQAMVATVRSIVGPAALYMPHGFASAGTTAGIVVSVLSFALFVVGVSRLIKSWDWAVHNGHRVHSFEGLATKLVSKQLGAFVATAVVAEQAGVCVSYFIFVAENFREVCKSLGAPRLSVPLLVVLMVGLEAPLSCVRRIKTLSAANAAGNLLVAFSLLVILGFSLYRLEDSGVHSGVKAFCPGTLYLFVGTAIFSFEGAASLTIPIASAVRPESRKSFLVAYNLTVLGIAVFYAVYGIVAYMAFGPDVEVIVTMSLPAGVWPGTIVRLMYTFVVLLSFPLQLFPVSESLEQCLFPLLGLPLSTPDASSGDAKQRRDESDGYAAHNSINANGVVDAAVSDRNGPSASSRGVGRWSYSPLLHQGRVSEGMACANALGGYCPPTGRDANAKLPGHVFRVSLVVLFGLVAVWQRHALDHIISLMGSLMACPLALVAPALMHMKLPGSTPTSRIVDRLLIGLGVALTIVTTTITLATWNDASSR